MTAVLVALLASIRAGFRTRLGLHLEVLALRHQLAVYQRGRRRAQTRVADRLLWARLSRAWSGWREALVFVQPSTVLAWQRRRFRDHWARLSRRAPGRPAVAKATRDLIRRMSIANPGWGSPRIIGEGRPVDAIAITDEVALGRSWSVGGFINARASHARRSSCESMHDPSRRFRDGQGTSSAACAEEEVR
jgi:hypothetical protein